MTQHSILTPISTAVEAACFLYSHFVRGVSGADIKRNPAYAEASTKWVQATVEAFRKDLTEFLETQLEKVDGPALVELPFAVSNSSAPPARPGVKGLVWSSNYAHTVFGLFYKIEKNTGVDNYFVLEKHTSSSVTKSGHSSEDSAREHADRDFFDLIQSVLL